MTVPIIPGDMYMEKGDGAAALREYQRVLLERPDWQEIRDKMETAKG